MARTVEQIDEKIKELKKLNDEKIKELRKQQRKIKAAEKKEQLKIKEKNDKKILALIKLFYSTKSDEEIIELWSKSIKDKQPEKSEMVDKILNKR